MELIKNISTKYGVVEVTFTLDDGVWVASNNTGNLGVVVQEDSYNKAYESFIDLYYYMYEFSQVYDNNPNKGIVDRKILPILFNPKDFWKLHKN